MDIDVIILASLASIWLLIMVMRTNVSLAIMGLCAGYVFSDLLSDEIIELVGRSSFAVNTIPIFSFVSIALIHIPALLILVRFRAHQNNRTLQHIIPAIGFALLATSLVFANVPLESERYLRDTSIVFQQMESFQVLIAVAVVGIAVVDVVLHDGEHHRKYKKRHKE